MIAWGRARCRKFGIAVAKDTLFNAHGERGIASIPVHSRGAACSIHGGHQTQIATAPTYTWHLCTGFHCLHAWQRQLPLWHVPVTGDSSKLVKQFCTSPGGMRVNVSKCAATA